MAVWNKTGKRRMKAAYKEGQVSLTHLLLNDWLTACATRFSVTELYCAHKVYFLEQKPHVLSTAQLCSSLPSAFLVTIALHLSKPILDSWTQERADVQLPRCMRNAAWHALSHFLTRTIKAGKRHRIRRKIKQNPACRMMWKWEKIGI
jgi:hypothetical protein